MTVTQRNIQDIGKNISAKKAADIATALNAVLPLYGMANADIFHEFIANVMEECGEFSRMEENLNYTTPQRLMAVWPGRFPTIAAAQPFTRNPQKLAMKVYGKRADLGNITDADGWNFRGGGPIQITGRLNYTLFTAHYNRITGSSLTMEQVADLVRTDLTVGLHSACWIFSIAKNLISLAIADELKKIVRRINGGLTNYPTRQKYYDRAVKAVPD